MDNYEEIQGIQDDQDLEDDTEEDTSGSHLYNLLVEHVTNLHKFGAPVDELIKFVNDVDAVTEFFESSGHGQNLRLRENPKEAKIKQKTSVTSTGTNTSDNVNHNGVYSRLSKLVRVITYIFIFIIITAIGHIGICHFLDVNPLKYFPSLQEKRCLLPAHPILMEMSRPIADCGFCSGGESDTKKITSGKVSDNGIVIEMDTTPVKSEFAKVAYLSKPVIIRGGGRGGGMPEGFNFEKLKNIFQSEPGGVDAVSEECQFLPFRSPFTSLREAFDKIAENSTWDEPWYIGWSNCHPGVAAKLRELFPRPDFLPEDSSSSAIDWIFIGSPGLGASIHIDYVKRPSWQAQLSGIKRWILHPPPECEVQCPGSVTFTIYPGDLLFLETNTWYHETFIDSDSLSISIGSEYD